MLGGLCSTSSASAVSTASPSPHSQFQRVLAGPAAAESKPRTAEACPQSRLCFYDDTDFNGALDVNRSVPLRLCLGSSFSARSVINNTLFAHDIWRESGCSQGESIRVGPGQRVTDIGFDAHYTSRVLNPPSSTSRRKLSLPGHDSPGQSWGGLSRPARPHGAGW
ncbi:peptidase inhibitor family I36 protein [Nonomuraea sp. NPDC049695]|uniref:peptidase inhibitor family I36 protein n=1 Tax=Nonomuraea sp. NPDC049695 TaxID=3154734 RepID=UPI003412A01D